MSAHTHIQRPIAHEREPPLRLIDLHRGHANIERDTITMGMALAGQGLSHEREAGLKEGKVAGRLQGLSKLGGRGIAV